MASLSSGFFIYCPVWFVDTRDPRGLQVVLPWLLHCLYEGSLQTLMKALWSLRVTYMIHIGQEFQTTFPPLLHPTQPSSLDEGLKENSERRPYWALWAILAKMLWALDRKSILSLGLTHSSILHSFIQLCILLSLSHLSPIQHPSVHLQTGIYSGHIAGLKVPFLHPSFIWSSQPRSPGVETMGWGGVAVLVECWALCDGRVLAEWQGDQALPYWLLLLSHLLPF